MLERAGVLFRERRYGDAEREYRAALELCPDNSWILGDLGIVLYSVGRRDEGLEFLEAAVRARPGRMKPRLDKARILASEGDEAGAVRVLEAGIRAAITDQEFANDALLLLGALKRRAGEDEQASIIEELLRRRGVRVESR
jgi:Tfp pilus assembly protein PilF